MSLGLFSGLHPFSLCVIVCASVCVCISGYVHDDVCVCISGYVHDDLRHHIVLSCHALLAMQSNLEMCGSLRVLYLYENCIERIENLDSIPTVTNLYLQKNAITRMENLEATPHLTKL